MPALLDMAAAWTAGGDSTLLASAWLQHAQAVLCPQIMLLMQRAWLARCDQVQGGDAYARQRWSSRCGHVHRLLMAT